MPAISGQEYIDRINRLNAEIWIEGKRVEGNISDHPIFSGIIKSQSKLYDLQLETDKANIMTFTSPTTGNKVGTSFLVPKTKEDLHLRRLMVQEWARTSAGMLGRSPDYMNTVLMAFTEAADVFQDSDRPFAQNLRNFFDEAMENDYSLTHTFINPQVNRSQAYLENMDQIISAQTIKSNEEGIVVKGARLLATQGGITDEILVFPTPSSMINSDFAYAFSIPSNTPGLKFLCRESFNYKKSSFNHPLSSHFDENDTVVVFDDVTVPWERVFCYQNPKAAYSIFDESSFYPLAVHQVTARRIIKTEFILGVAQMIVDTINVGDYQHIKQKISEIIVGLESLKALICASEVNAQLDKWGTMTPDFNSLSAAILLYSRMYPRYCEIIQQIGASGLVTIPGEEDFSSEIGNDLEIYLQAANANGVERVKLFRLAWDISMSSFGTRQMQYERFFFGDPIRLECNLYQSYNKEGYIDFVNKFFKGLGD
ncbi:4-hydroxyphenylacetate 3-monooxygenase, oxygenase component [Neobacillus massiliamazoniensis]|uniref:4-hydroxyphenylacetate 3-monooxygenase oxygenase subunit n=1 Tax=Neobacillus massiliamazoniensis TaxID=1499688 RepID=A0A0U1NSH0_9BACI|nr:4-hydroxyphenylacetate 3-monooxygenase, oxygenase component [Neobacillus massiliamazoniensis]CRK80993.1 4-hydroxyphenylacetate 3-monooxygenase oxygenase subunit [Neobacillus massiliamazoniensis]